ncbi:hypothetical protein [Methyloversatilis discipulorum]|jgi:hypothetical protein|uniref:hypothetical protein n=1 Tax=Methyloversatilis discipulorum TaxID=1119528 RepID=UPI0012FB062C|nr:hypothetical protein [Methyloversatilis discipulorum]
MKSIDELVPDDKDYRALMLARAYAINSYVRVEHDLASLYQVLALGDLEASHWAFFKLSSRHRFDALRLLGEKRDPQVMEPFGRSLLAAGESLVDSRNFIVHSSQIIGAESLDLATGRRKRFENFLHAPGYLNDLGSERKLFLHDVLEFIRRINYYDRVLRVLSMHFHGHTLDEWAGILSTKFVWVPAKDHPAHPLYLLREE